MEREPHEDSSRTLPKRIADVLARRIMEGAYETGSRLPTERELAVEFGANRNAVREAIKRLEAVGALESRRGAGTYVAEVGFATGVRFVETMITREDGSVDLDSLRDALEFRANMVRVIVRAAAARRTETQLQEILRLYAEHRQIQRQSSGRDQDVMLNLFRLIVEASHNRAYRLMHSTAMRAYLQLRSAVDQPQAGTHRMDALLEGIINAIADADPVRAELAVVRFMETLQVLLFGKADPAMSAPFAISGPMV